MHGYPDLTAYEWTRGVHKAPVGYQHPWLVVTSNGTLGAWTRERARRAWSAFRSTNDLQYAAEVAEAQW